MSSLQLKVETSLHKSNRSPPPPPPPPPFASQKKKNPPPPPPPIQLMTKNEKNWLQAK